MRIDQLIGKPVIGARAQVLGEVCDIEINEKTMKLVSICVKLNDDAIEPMGFKKPRLRGSVRVDIPIDIIKAIGDVVNVDKSADELGTIVKRR